MPKLNTSSYRLLAAFRYEIRKFLAFSEGAARDAGVEPQQHQFLLAVRGLPEALRPTIGTIAERLCVQHHTAVALVDKLETRGFLLRERGVSDRREVLLRMTPEGEAILRALSAQHRAQLSVVGPSMVEALQALVDVNGKESREAEAAKGGEHREGAERSVPRSRATRRRPVRT